MMMFKTLNRFLIGTRSRREKTRLGGVRKHVVSRWWFGGGCLVAVVVLVVVVWLRRIHCRALSLFLCSFLSLDSDFYGVIFLVFIVFKRNNCVWVS